MLRQREREGGEEEDANATKQFPKTIAKRIFTKIVLFIAYFSTSQTIICLRINNMFTSFKK